MNFYPHGALHSAVFAVIQCLLSVCLSVTLVYCIHIAEDIVKLLSQPGSPIILVF